MKLGKVDFFVFSGALAAGTVSLRPRPRPMLAPSASRPLPLPFVLAFFILMVLSVDVAQIVLLSAKDTVY